MSPEMIAALDAWAAELDDNPNRSEMIRRIIADWMARERG